MLISQLRGNREAAIEEGARARKVVLLEGDLAQLLQTHALTPAVPEPAAELEALLTPGRRCREVALGPRHEAGTSHRLGAYPARLASARECRRQPCATFRVTASRVPESSQGDREPKVGVGVGAA